MNNLLPLVSIIIPVYNGSNYLQDAIESALAQIYPKIEVIVVNDGSNDAGKTERIALSFGDDIRYIYKENGGVATALNSGIQLMRGEYFSWLSHDDLYLPNKISTQVAWLNETGKWDTILFSDYINVSSKDEDLYTVRMDHELLEKKPLYAVFRGALHGCTLLIPRKAFHDVGLFNNLRTTQDYELWFRIIRRYDFKHIPIILVRSRLHPNQGSGDAIAANEADRLWITMMKSLHSEEIMSLECTEAVFFNGMAQFLRDKPYKQAYRYAKRHSGEVSLSQDTKKEVLRKLIRSKYFPKGLRHSISVTLRLYRRSGWFISIAFIILIWKLEMRQNKNDKLMLARINTEIDNAIKGFTK